jgi:hypothetical protein
LFRSTSLATRRFRNSRPSSALVFTRSPTSPGLRRKRSRVPRWAYFLRRDAQAGLFLRARQAFRSTPVRVGVGLNGKT